MEERILWRSPVEMERWESWIFNFKSSFLLPTKWLLVKVTSCLRVKAKENGHGLVTLYKDKEACAGYGDIQVMWEIIHSSNATNGPSDRSRKRPSQWRCCFRTT